MWESGCESPDLCVRAELAELAVLAGLSRPSLFPFVVQHKYC